MLKEHLYWIDWMKVIGIYFIVLGHLFPIGNEYIYVFSVPLFFIISGFLAHAEDNWKAFWKKAWNNLILPLIIFCLVLHLANIFESVFLGKFEPERIPRHIFNCLIGMQGNKDVAGGLGVCWFIYTLIICKLTQQLIGRRIIFQSIVIIVCISGAIWYNSQNAHYYNAIVDTTLAYPLYAIGGGGQFIKLSKVEKVNRLVLLMCLFLCIGLVFLVGYYNGGAKMYDALYGKNIVLFFMGSLAGTVAIYIFSVLIQNKRPKFLGVISMGTIIILGLHPLFIRAYQIFIEPYKSVVLDYLVALFIVFAFVPIIILSKRFFPIMLGSRAHKENNKIIFE